MIKELLHEAIVNLKQRKLRSFLAASGILWGSYAVIMLFALGQGYYSASKDKLSAINRPTAAIYLQPISIASQGQNVGTVVALPLSEIMQLPQAIPGIAAITPFGNTNVTMLSNTQSLSGTVTGVSPDYFNMYDFYIKGRSINAMDIRERRQVIFLSNNDKVQLFADRDPIGKSISVNGINFRVIGYTSQPNTWLSQTSIPYTTFAALFYDRATMMRVLLQPQFTTDQFKQQFLIYLARRYHISPADNQVIQDWDFTQFASTLNSIILAARLFIDFCGVMTLIVGGIGIANMLYLLVKERTREIGLRMALGAEPKWILLGFLLESALLVTSGALCAAILSVISLKILQHVNLPDWLGRPSLSHADMLSIMLILLSTALFAGFSPARQAARMQPVDALSARG